MTRVTTILIAAGMPVLLGGCADYLNNRDTVTFGSGDAVAWNRAVHTENPWNRDSQNTDINSNGQVVAVAQKRRLFLPGSGLVPAAPANGNGASTSGSGSSQ